MSRPLPPPPQIDQPHIPPSGKLPLGTPLLYIATTQTKGLGLFAAKNLAPDTLLLLESPLLHISNSEISDLTPHSQSAWAPITTYFSGILQDPLNRVVDELPFNKQLVFYNLSSAPGKGSRERGICWRNGLAVEGLSGTVVLGMGGRVNHSCAPNAKISWCTAEEMECVGGDEEPDDGCMMSGGLNNGEVFTTGPSACFDGLVFDAPKERGGKMMLWNHLPINKGEEITIDYGYGVAQLKEDYGFDCTCSYCISGLVRSDLAESRRGSVRSDVSESRRSSVRYSDKGCISGYTSPNKPAKNYSESIEAVTRNYNYDRLAKKRSKSSGIGVLETLFRVQGDQAGDFEDSEMGSSEYQTCEEFDLPTQRRPLPPIPEKNSPAALKVKDAETSTTNSSYANILEAKTINYQRLNHSSVNLINMSKVAPPVSSQTSPSLHPSKSRSLSPPSSDPEDVNLPPLRDPETLGDLIIISTSNKHRGLGVFALKPLMSGTLVLLEYPLLRLEFPTSSYRASKHIKPDPIDAIVHALPPSRRSAFCQLHRHSTSPANPYREIIWTNAFGVNKGDNAVFEVTCRINHACRPNCKWHWKPADKEKGEVEGKMMVYALRDISEGEELSIDYGFTSDELERQYGFRCDCGNCDDEIGTLEGGEQGRFSAGVLSEGAGTELTPHIKVTTKPTSNSAAKAVKVALDFLIKLAEQQDQTYPSRPSNPTPEYPLNALIKPFSHNPSILHAPRRRPETLGTMLEIRPSFLNSQPRGLGVFALHDIAPSRLLLDEAPLFTYPSHATFAHVLYALSKLEPEEMTTINTLCTLQTPAGRELEIDELLRASAFLRLDGKWKGIFEVTCRINHACGENANCNWVWGQRMLVRAKRTILKGEEVTISYGLEEGEGMRENYGFVCQCGVGCVNEKDRRLEN